MQWDTSAFEESRMAVVARSRLTGKRSEVRHPKFPPKTASMLFRLLKPLRSQAVILALGTAWVLVQPAGWPMAAGIPNVPTHYIYAGQNVPLPVDLGRVAIEYKPGASSANLISSLKGWGIEVASEISTGVENRHHFELQTVRQDAAEMYALVEQLAESPDVAFASAVVHGTGGEWCVVRAEMLARLGGA